MSATPYDVKFSLQEARRALLIAASETAKAAIGPGAACDELISISRDALKLAADTQTVIVELKISTTTVVGLDVP